MNQIVTIKNNNIKLNLTNPMSKVRICDENGNHVARPALEGKYRDDNYIEWMITNAEIKLLVDLYLDKKAKQDLRRKLIKIKRFLKPSKFAVRQAQKTRLKSSFLGFEIYEYKEKFYSFEKTIDQNIKIRLTFKMGDFTLAVHMFVLIPFNNKNLSVFNENGKLMPNQFFGSGAFAYWSSPTENQIKSIISGLAQATKKHRDGIAALI